MVKVTNIYKFYLYFFLFLGCLPNKWGFNCENQCHCADSTPCDSHTGYCTNGKCISGYTGLNCFTGKILTVNFYKKKTLI